jgi:hypothetical protein
MPIENRIVKTLMMDVLQSSVAEIQILIIPMYHQLILMVLQKQSLLLLYVWLALRQKLLLVNMLRIRLWLQP